MMKGNTHLILSILLSCLLLTITGCKELNDNPPPVAEGSALINVEGLLAQMNANPGLQEQDANQSVAITDTDVSSEAKTLLVGAFLASGRTSPVPADYEMTGSILSFFGKSLTNSSEFLQLVSLPVSSNYIEFKVPPQTAGNWQVIAIAMSTQPETIADISATENKYSAVYSGTNPNFFAADDLGNTAIPVKIKRVCLMSSNPPNGCASFGATHTADPVVTASVEIVGVRVDGSDYTPNTVDFPIMVRTASDVTDAITDLTTIRDEVTDSLTPTSLTVRVTHSENTTETADCQALSDVTNQNEFTNTRLRTHCEVTDHTVYY